MPDVVELFDVVHERREDGQLVETDRVWIGILLPAGDETGDRLTRQQAVEVLQRYAVDEKDWPSYPGSVGVSGPHPYVRRRGELVRAVRWAPGDEAAGSWWRVVLGQGMDAASASDMPVSFDEPLEL
jgi:hypothetical protein